MADHQTAGRGRRGRTWEAPAGANLLASVLLRPGGLPLERRHLVVACVALAARESCSAVSGGAVDAELKWPNDLLVAGRKLAGVLAEAEGEAVVVGLGLNVGWAPPGATSLAAQEPSSAPTPAAVLEALLPALARRYEGGDWAGVAADYRRACVTLGTEVRVELADETFTGVAADVSDDGHLLVETPACLRTVTAGDVVHLR